MPQAPDKLQRVPLGENVSSWSIKKLLYIIIMSRLEGIQDYTVICLCCEWNKRPYSFMLEGEYSVPLYILRICSRG